MTGTITKKRRDSMNMIGRAFAEGYELDPIEPGHKAAFLAGTIRMIDADGFGEEFRNAIIGN